MFKREDLPRMAKKFLSEITCFHHDGNQFEYDEATQDQFASELAFLERCIQRLYEEIYNQAMLLTKPNLTDEAVGAKLQVELEERLRLFFALSKEPMDPRLQDLFVQLFQIDAAKRPGFDKMIEVLNEVYEFEKV